MTTQFPSAMNKVSLILSLASGISDTQLKFCDLEAFEYGRKAGSFLNSIHAVTSKWYWLLQTKKLSILSLKKQRWHLWYVPKTVYTLLGIIYV